MTMRSELSQCRRVSPSGIIVRRSVDGTWLALDVGCPGYRASS